MIVVPPDRIANDLLDALLESYISREGTDYGETELSLDDKLRVLKPQIKRGEVLIIYDESSESFNLLSREDYLRQSGEPDA